MIHQTRRYLTALPVYNEAAHVDAVLDQVVEHATDVLVIDDGSTDGTAERLAARSDVFVVRHLENRGYGAALKTAFDYAIRFHYDVLVTIDCDGQHEPQRIEMLVDACRHADIVSGSRYLEASDAKSQAPAERRQINQMITREINQRLGLSLTDAFCGIVTCDRAKMYWRVGRIQWCWAHLRRDFQALIDRGDNQAKRLGYDLRRATDKLFEHWANYRDGPISRAAFLRRMAPVRREVERLLLRGIASGNKSLVGMCRELHEHREWLWTFVRCEGVEPTNNAGERALGSMTVL